MPICEPTPFETRWFSHKLNGAGLTYEIGLCLQTGWIVWVNGPFPAGWGNDKQIAESEDGLVEMLDDDEMVIADGVYYDGYRVFMTPGGIHDDFEYLQSVSRARHETVNTRFKFFRCMKVEWHHEKEKHRFAFGAIVAITQLKIQTDEPLFGVHYDDTDEIP